MSMSNNACVACVAGLVCETYKVRERALSNATNTHRCAICKRAYLYVAQLCTVSTCSGEIFYVSEDCPFLTETPFSLVTEERLCEECWRIGKIGEIERSGPVHNV